MRRVDRAGLQRPALRARHRLVRAVHVPGRAGTRELIHVKRILTVLDPVAEERVEVADRVMERIGEIADRVARDAVGGHRQAP